MKIKNKQYTEYVPKLNLTKTSDYDYDPKSGRWIVYLSYIVLIASFIFVSYYIKN